MGGRAGGADRRHRGSSDRLALPGRIRRHADAPISITDADFGRVAAQVLGDAIKETVDPDGPVKVSSTVREGNAAQVLLETAMDADLLVVGSRGHGGFAEALLGSVSQHCVHHARCPVVIIRARATG
jgi:nucleotide-binding universal stress UspA family protein